MRFAWFAFLCVIASVDIVATGEGEHLFEGQILGPLIGAFIIAVIQNG
jgi:hypothetical protein